jgi:hypothetical protein
MLPHAKISLLALLFLVQIPLIFDTNIKLQLLYKVDIIRLGGTLWVRVT